MEYQGCYSQQQLRIISRMHVIIDCLVVLVVRSFIQAITALNEVDLQVLSVANSEQVRLIDYALLVLQLVMFKMEH